MVNIDVENKTESKIEEILKKNNQEEKNYLSVESENDFDSFNPKSTFRSAAENNIITNDYVIYDKYKTELISIEFPSDCRKKLSTKLSSILLDVKKKARKGDIIENFNYKIQQAFYKFLVGIFYGFSDYLLKSKYFYESMKNGNCGDNMRYKSQIANVSDINFLKEIFNIDECVKIYSNFFTTILLRVFPY